MNKEEIKNNAFFKTLPKLTQESILMSGVAFDNENDIRKFIQNLNQ